MTFPNFEITTGLKLTADGRDVQVLWPSDGNEWTAATVRALLWQIKGQWIFDLDAGIAYDRVLGLPADPREVQEIFREQISKYVDLTSLTVAIEGEDVRVAWTGSGGEYGSISLLEPPAVVSVTPVSWEIYTATEIAIRFSDSLNTARVPAVETFEIQGQISAVNAASVRGNHLFLTLDPSLGAGGFVLLYNPDNRPMQSIDRADVAPFRLEFAADLLLTEGGDTLTTEAGDSLALE